MSAAEVTVTLRNGVVMPAVALGCWSGTTAEEQRDGWKWMMTGLQAGYKQLDTARIYKTETTVAKAVKEAGVKREDLFITTKMKWDWQAYDVQKAFKQSLRDLATDYIDLYLIHWPMVMAIDENGHVVREANGKDLRTVDVPNFKTCWAEFEKIYESGKVRAIGVSNFSIKTLNELLETAKIVPHVNQVEMHPYLAQPDLMAYCTEKGIMMTAYTPTGYATVRADPTISEIAKKYNVSPAQIILAWHLKRGVTVAVRSTSAERQKDNINLPTLSEEDFQTINKLDRGQRVCNVPDERGMMWGWTKERLGW
ncbi:reductase AKOR2 [Cristinia sonorae]|uniref:Reductase AKOR2 n=1 Tax=Cristinia sonorae TaxID=1940300 RepID=A0A8K0UEX7_9AGAR|nr:reductase AKOR2 [Cristinia sonorae]